MKEVILILLLLFVAYLNLDGVKASQTAQATAVGNKQATTQPKQSTQTGLPPYYENVEDLKQIPKALPPQQFSDPTTQRAYEVARDNPKLLLQLPCFCPCDRVEIGHKSLLDCFVDEHAAECGICKSEALTAARLQSENWSVEKIRARLIADYSKAH